MKTLKHLFLLLITSIILSSCTPQAIDDEQNNNIENIQATGDDDASTSNGSKD